MNALSAAGKLGAIWEVASRAVSRLLLIFVFVPFVSRKQNTPAPIECVIELPVSETWGQALITTLGSYLKNFWYIARVALPLMILAAFLGALVIEMLPARALFVPVSLIGIVAVAIVSSFLPVPWRST